VTRHTDPDLRELFAEAGRYGARSRDLGTTLDDRRRHTEPARAARFANYVERLKKEIDPDGRLDDDELDRQVKLLLEAREHKRKMDELRRQRRERLIGSPTADFVEAHAS
jgi:predicted metal-dependent hydrolase